MIFYKLRKKSDPDLYVRGTPVYLDYDKQGRIFQKIGQLRTFLTGCLNLRHSARDITEWEVVELETVERSVKEVIEIVKPEKIVEILKREVV